ncbi:MAG: hypothetical protein JXB62_01820 [Pirellulales bacterium]|nr:hypothetical protein [Pirellulales bacterium]
MPRFYLPKHIHGKRKHATRPFANNKLVLPDETESGSRGHSPPRDIRADHQKQKQR